MKISPVLVMLLLSSMSISAQEFYKMDKSPMDASYYPAEAPYRAFAKTKKEKIASEPVIRVLYSRPQKKDRDIFGGLIKYGETWRLGANETTEILFLKDVTINDIKVAAGRYAVHATVNEKNWDIHFNIDLDGWGSYAYKKEQNVASITVDVEQAKETIEAFSIIFEEIEGGAHMIMGWDDVVVRVPIGL
jgi:hypothetical protein